MPKRVKPAAKRLQLTEEALTAQGESGPCSTERFPKDVVITGADTKTMMHPEKADKRKYMDLLEVRGGKTAPIKSEHMLLLASKEEALRDIHSVCQLLVVSFGKRVASRAQNQSGRVYGAV